MATFPHYPDTPPARPPQKYYVKNFRGANVNAPRLAIDDNQFAWLENLFPVGPGNLRAMYAEGSSIFTASGSLNIIHSFFFNIGAGTYAAVFLSDGTAIQVNTQSGVQATMSAALGTFYAGGYLPACAQWNAAGIIIVTEATNPSGYYAWDGITLYGPGSNAPNWLTNTTPTIMPQGVHGNAVEVYQNRAWITTPPSPGIPATVTQTAPSNGADFSTSDGAGTTPQQDSSLRYQFNALRQSNGFLYLLGDSNVAIISNVQTAGVPALTTYSNQNLDPQVGCGFSNTAQLFGQAVIFANTQGVFVLSGGTVQKVSHDLDALFRTMTFSPAPSGAVATIFGVRCYVILVNAPDQNGNLRTFLCVWNGQDWFFASQTATLTAIWTQEVNSVLSAWGTDGTHLVQLFQAPSTSLNKILRSKLTGTLQDDEGFIAYKKFYRFYLELFDRSGAGATLAGTYDTDTASTALSLTSVASTLIFVNGSAQQLIFVNGSAAPISFGVPGTAIGVTDAACYGLVIGVSLNTITGADFSLVAFMIGFSYDAPLGG